MTGEGSEVQGDKQAAQGATGVPGDPELEASAGVDPGGESDGEGAEPAFSLQLPAFEGPLALLLELIERRQLDVTEVSLLEVTEQYLANLRAREAIDLGALADFVAVGARLLLLKSRALLPRDEDEQPEDDDESDAQSLVEALREYRRFKEAAEYLRERDGGHATYRRDAAPPKTPLPTGLDTVSLDSLVDLIRDVLSRMPEEEEVVEVERDPVRLRDRMSRLVDRLEESGRASFRQLVGEARTRTEVIVDFMAVLELIKSRYLVAQQSESFGDIDLVRLEGAQAPDVEAVEDFHGA
ncbi:MAG: hypothetical protein GEU80_00140 [Dehalococcoidia bacterium]|nr:hypothetical protein [Dehalococcoidia bacterium]